VGLIGNGVSITTSLVLRRLEATRRAFGVTTHHFTNFMIVDLTDEEICLVVQSIETVDWSYCGHDGTAKSVIRKCREAATKKLKAQEKLKE
jgi:hypothetical protein